ncbi:hypothetical protein B0H19DRAFT_1280037 [Mycena capillaripes]|nr:hypothetical protein B0H19DRAFT_1280037 [Mycena capillaripes]
MVQNYLAAFAPRCSPQRTHRPADMDSYYFWFVYPKLAPTLRYSDVVSNPQSYYWTMAQFFQLSSHLINTLIQTATIKTGSYGRVSGQDSVWRATMATMDHTLGMGFLAGLCNMVFDPNNFLRLPIWDFLHTRAGVRAGEVVLTFRNSIAGIKSATRRKGTLTRVEGPLISQPGPSSAPDNAETNEVEFTPNLSQSFIPYIMAVNPASRHVTVARSVARFTICLASLLLVFTARVVFLSFFMRAGWTRNLLYAAEVGRMIMILMQESSILTYSCAYKCVETWACQGVYNFGPSWSDQEQDDFDRDTVEFIGYAFHAQAIFWAVSKFWKAMGKYSPLWEDRFGPSISAHFTNSAQSTSIGGGLS